MYAGAVIGSNVQRQLPRTFRDADRRVLLVAGAAAGVAAIFKAPATGAVFAIEVPYQDPKRSIGIIFAILCLRCLATATAVAGGGNGGLFVPLVVAGALTGSIVGRAVNHGDLTLFIVIGVAACVGAGYRVPLAAVVFVAETTGRPSFIVPGLLAAVAADLMMGASSVTKLQQSAELQREDGVPQRHPDQQHSDESENPSP